MAKRLSDEAKVEMTPMIDVVFQLLIFFVVTLKQDDILAKLTAARPQPPPEDILIEVSPPLIDITVNSNGILFKGKPVSRETLDRTIERYSKFSRDANITIRCTNDSKQSYLVQAMDICAKHKMKNMSILSM